ncbi:hypothetical protein CYLTODRAFT_405355 [Cylindrobasidium torrendii FP15055 ss-10]|uniref:Uncharacterized protein n=1 Tax=Cylindrobasidium torrendii FP15055 ss-10 TaxID=1314674 RepID=A0A0D7AV39_9AGAR|nr:hypothetical protein CYLTODRAFT_405355 [Cylindrobasidium torrendii FP15055 ss-10]
MDKIFLAEVFSVVYSAGLDDWHPDFQNTADSAYNLLHEVIATKTFLLLLKARQYRSLKVDASFAGDAILLRRIYRHFVFHYLLKRSKLEAAKPGSVRRGNEASKAYKRRSALAVARAEHAKKEGFPMRVIRLLEDPDAHSDDEQDPTGERYRINNKAYRSQLVTNFIRKLDSHRLEAKARAPYARLL